MQRAGFFGTQKYFTKESAEELGKLNPWQLKNKNINTIVEYKFISIQGNTKDLNFNDKSDEVSIGSNLELMKIVYDFEACSEDYQRHFKLNKLLK